MNTKPNILIFIDWFVPGYHAGGPVQSILSLINHLHEDFNFKIITTNRDLNTKIPYSNITPNKWIKSNLNCEIYYAEPEKLSYKSMKQIIDDLYFDKVYINSFFSKKFSIIPLKILNKYYPKKNVILAPRGMLGKGALSIKKIKKQIFILYSKQINLHNSIIWHATSVEEELDIKNNFSSINKIVVINNLPKKIISSPIITKKHKKLNVFFLARISEKKNLIYALEILKKIEFQEIVFSIYGPIEDMNYWRKCEKKIKLMPKNIIVNYKGSIDPKDIKTILIKEHLLLLPSLNENFGHSIVESLLCGCPVIISDQTPWNDLEENNAGFAINLNNEQKFINSIHYFLELNTEEFTEVSKRAISYISKKIDLNLILHKYKNLFNDKN